MIKAMTEEYQSNFDTHDYKKINKEKYDQIFNDTLAYLVYESTTRKYFQCKICGFVVYSNAFSSYQESMSSPFYSKIGSEYTCNELLMMNALD